MSRVNIEELAAKLKGAVEERIQAAGTIAIIVEDAASTLREKPDWKLLKELPGFPIEIDGCFLGF